MELSNPQYAVFQALQSTDKLECALKVLHDKNALLRIENIILRGKVIELETKLAEIQKIPAAHYPPLRRLILTIPILSLKT
ncbi:MAG: hypothetical protein AMR96_03780 [Candidatus Adiutrix intracellularis]|nr:MAG: hypothetical protein AMR96_03780 [Candidatus Adiutrix intracellularis]